MLACLQLFDIKAVLKARVMNHGVKAWGRGNFQDKKRDFGHLMKWNVELEVRWEDEYGEDFKNVAVIEFSAEDS